MNPKGNYCILESLRCLSLYLYFTARSYEIDVERIQHHNQVEFAKDRSRLEVDMSKQKHQRFVQYSKIHRRFMKEQDSWLKTMKEEARRSNAGWKEDGDSKREKRVVRKSLRCLRVTPSDTFYGT